MQAILLAELVEQGSINTRARVKFPGSIHIAFFICLTQWMEMHTELGLFASDPVAGAFIYK